MEKFFFLKDLWGWKIYKVETKMLVEDGVDTHPFSRIKISEVKKKDKRH